MKIKITKKHAIIGIAVIILIGVGFFFLGGAQSVDSNAGVKAEQSAEIVKDAADDGEKAVDKDKKTETNKSEKAEKNDSADKKSNATSEKKDTSKNNSNSSNSGNKNNSSSSNSGSSSGSSNKTPSKPTHTHNWVAVYETQYVKVGVASICSTCGTNITGQTASHAEKHMLNGENGGHYSETIYDEKQVYLYDKCSCGATR